MWPQNTPEQTEPVFREQFQRERARTCNWFSSYMLLYGGKQFFDVAWSVMEENKVQSQIKHTAGQTSLLLKSRRQACGSGSTRCKARYRHSHNAVQAGTSSNTAPKARRGKLPTRLDLDEAGPHLLQLPGRMHPMQACCDCWNLCYRGTQGQMVRMSTAYCRGWWSTLSYCIKVSQWPNTLSTKIFSICLS